MNIYEQALKLHSSNKGKISVISKVNINNTNDLSLAYSPGVAEPCREIAKDKEKIYEYTSKGNMVAVVTSGTAVLGLGDIGAEASLPVMEGKAALFKKFAGLDAFPICLDTKNSDKIVETVKLLSPVFAGVNLEDIAAPECFYIEKRLKEETDLAIFHDDQHGTAIVIMAGLYNAIKLTGRNISTSKIVINGAGASATATLKMLLKAGASKENIIVCDSKGIIHSERINELNNAKQEIIELSNTANIKGGLAEAIKDADIFIGLSVGGVLSKEMVMNMDKNPIIFALANPDPEISPELAYEAGAKIVATGRSDYNNQINNVLAFPGVLRGALSIRAKEINYRMKLSAARAISNFVTELDYNKIIPGPFESGVTSAVALAVASSAMETDSARIYRDNEDLKVEFDRLTY